MRSLEFFIIGASYAFGNMLAAGEWRIPSLPRVPQIRSGRRRSDQLVMHGGLWVVMWMTIGAVLGITFLPLFPEFMVEWVDQGQDWALGLRGQLSN